MDSIPEEVGYDGSGGGNDSNGGSDSGSGGNSAIGCSSAHPSSLPKKQAPPKIRSEKLEEQRALFENNKAREIADLLERSPVDEDGIPTIPPETDAERNGVCTHCRLNGKQMNPKGPVSDCCRPIGYFLSCSEFAVREGDGCVYAKYTYIDEEGKKQTVTRKDCGWRCSALCESYIYPAL